MTRNRRSYQYTGRFALSQPKCIISDPSYHKRSKGNHTVTNCDIGEYVTYVNINHYQYRNADNKNCHDYRVASAFIVHNLLPKSILSGIHLMESNENGKLVYRFKAFSNWQPLSRNIWVDSGQVGFFDYTKYGLNSLFKKQGKCDFGDKWYSNCCDATYNNYAGIIKNIGVNVQSGFGDGIYEVWGHQSTHGTIDAMAIFFMPDNEAVEFEYNSEE